MNSALSSVTSPVGTINDHWQTLKVGNSGTTLRWGAVAVLYVIPIFVSVFAVLFGTVRADASALLSAVAVFTGLIFNLSFDVFKKSLSMRQNPFEQGDAISLRLVDELFSNVNYAVLIGLITTAVLASSTMFVAPGWFPVAGELTQGISVALLVHLFFLSLMILKRFRALRETMKP